MAKAFDRSRAETFTARPRSDDSMKTFVPKVGGSVTPTTPTSEAAPSTPPPPAKDD